MAEKKYVSLDNLETYDDLIKDKITDNFNTAQAYTDAAVAQKSLVQIITWEADD